MNKQKIKTRCEKCDTSIEQDGVRSMKRCPGCGIKWQFTINDSGKVHLFENKPTKISPLGRKRSYTTSLSPYEKEKADAAGFGITAMTQAGYCLLVLRMNEAEVRKLYNVAL